MVSSKLVKYVTNSELTIGPFWQHPIWCYWYYFTWAIINILLHLKLKTVEIKNVSLILRCDFKYDRWSKKLRLSVTQQTQKMSTHWPFHPFSNHDMDSKHMLLNMKSKPPAKILKSSFLFDKQSSLGKSLLTTEVVSMPPIFRINLPL